MKNKDQVVQAALALIVSLATGSCALLATEAYAAEGVEKCYGIVKTGMNDCQTNTASCAGSATRDRQPDAFILLPKGTCTKIVGGSIVPIKETTQ